MVQFYQNSLVKSILVFSLFLMGKVCETSNDQLQSTMMELISSTPVLDVPFTKIISTPLQASESVLFTSTTKSSIMNNPAIFPFPSSSYTNSNIYKTEVNISSSNQKEQKQKEQEQEDLPSIRTDTHPEGYYYSSPVFDEDKNVFTVEFGNAATAAMTWITSEPSSAAHLQAPYHLPAGTVAGIVVASIGFLGILAAAIGFLAVKRFRPLHVKSYDFTGETFSYLDNRQVSYINPHVELPKESNDDLMFSLDNDSFLNSLEAMTMENYWAEDSKSTKV